MKIALVSFSLFTLSGALATWFLIDIPFGRLFDSVLLLSASGLACCLATSALLMLRSKTALVRITGVITGAVALAVVLLIVMLRVDYKLVPGLSYRSGLTVEEWKADLRYFAGEFPELHPRLFEMVERETFQSRVSELEKKIPSLDENSIKTEFYKLLALPSDAHSFPNIYSYKIDWHLLPLEFWLFDGGVLIIDAGRDHRETIGTYLVKVGDMPIEQVYERMRPCLAAESEQGWKVRFLHTLGISEWLESEGVIRDRRIVSLTFERKDGSRFTREIKPVHFIPVIWWSSLKKIDNNLSYIYSNDRNDNYWFEYNAGTGTLYLQFNRCLRESRKETIDEFVDRLGSWIENHDFERLVVDIRKNDGGDSYVSRVVADLIIGNEKVDRPGRLFALTSRKTFSAAVMFLSLLEYNSKVIILGEPTGQGPFFCGVPRTIALPNSGIELLIAGYYNRCALINDRKNQIIPDIYVPYTAEDFLLGRDSAMEAIASYRAVKPKVEVLDPEDAENLTGRYSYSPFQILSVEKDGEILRFTVTDFFEDSFRNAASDLYPAGNGLFLTDIDGVELQFVSRPGDDFEGMPGGQGAGRAEMIGAGVILRWRGAESFAPKVSPDYRLPMELVAEGRIEEGVSALIVHKDIYLVEMPDLERRLNGIGYTLLNRDIIKSAIEIFKLNVELFPASSNTYDSLGEGYLFSGDIKQAEENYRRSLELNPGNDNARKIIDHIEKGRRYDRASGKWIG